MLIKESPRSIVSITLGVLSPRSFGNWIAFVGSAQVRDPPFWDLRNDVDTILNYGISAVGGLTINEFECSWRGNPALEIGDKISITTKDNRTVTAFLLDDTLTYDGGLSQKTQWTYMHSIDF